MILIFTIIPMQNNPEGSGQQGYRNVCKLMKPENFTDCLIELCRVRPHPPSYLTLGTLGILVDHVQLQESP